MNLLLNLDLIFESSAKHGDNSKDIFFETAKLLYKDCIEKELNSTKKSMKSIKNERIPSFSLKKNINKKKIFKRNRTKIKKSKFNSKFIFMV